MKTAQVSIFIVVGIILLIAASIFLYSDSQKEEVAPGVFVSISQLPQELEPVNTFVMQCLDDIGSQGIRLIGEHGGYVSLDDIQLTKTNFVINSNPAMSDAVVFAPGSSLAIPYWWYLESDNNCVGTCDFATKRPPLRAEENSIEQQLNRYINKEIENCFNDFESLKQEGFQLSGLEKWKADTKIAENDVVIILDYPLQVTKGTVQADVEQFFVRIPVDLESAYNLATDVTNLEQEYRFLERQTMNLISAFSSVDETKLPPLSDMRFEYGSNIRWMKSDVKKKVSEVLMYYIPLFQVDGSKNFNRAFHSSQL